MNSNTENLKKIYEYCETHIMGVVPYCLNDNCVLYRNCICSKKKSRYNDPRFVNKCIAKVERALAKEREEMEADPFAEFRD